MGERVANSQAKQWNEDRFWPAPRCENVGLVGPRDTVCTRGYVGRDGRGMAITSGDDGENNQVKRWS
ncbi:hypothetical protein NL676_011884 [Syzygium grande]|nr:hypothetical protein NL676_011884 [Syzygium grande]